MLKVSHDAAERLDEIRRRHCAGVCATKSSENVHGTERKGRNLLKRKQNRKYKTKQYRDRAILHFELNGIFATIEQKVAHPLFPLALIGSVKMLLHDTNGNKTQNVVDPF